MGPEGQAQKDNWNWTDEVPQGRIEEVQEWIQVGLFAYRHHPSLVFVAVVFFFLLYSDKPMLTNHPFRENTVAKKRVKATADA